MKAKDLLGQKFGRLTVIKEAENKGKHRMWICKCECGKEKIIYQTHITTGKTTSCGCFRNEIVSETAKTIKTKHGMFGTRLYGIWHGIKTRCENPHNRNYQNYGGRDIRLCDEWQDFEPFKEWAFNNGYKDSLTIDRIDVNGNYEPSNCRWATVKEQQNNKRTNHIVTYNGETKTVSQWAEELGINRETIYTRLSRGWSAERALQC